MRRRSDAKKAPDAAETPAPETKTTITTHGDPEKVAETSKKLQEELDRNQPKSERIEFDRANAPKEKPLDPQFERIVESVFVDKPFEIYQALEAKLRVGDQRTDHGSVNKALDEAESNARLAYKLYCTAKIERERWEMDNDVIFGAMRAEATRLLQREKEQGLRSKQITDADVDSTCATMFADEWRHQQTKRKKVDLMVKSMENLSELWLSKCRSLNAMLSKQR